ncbi:VOC family protein [Antrihabitans cavernicola]|uniref:VOC family protein n=1 Tax=Antrihabitans cavernicola TaxID=2495913 RepID=A0A5A7SEY2_9NOCA|nr:VOC family protein [Spelaeibacter cavernicola]KAA0024658.1 VOC family protein [Spelaeibacter cavernicola]
MDTAFPWAHAFIDVPEEFVAASTDFWAAATGYDVGEPWRQHREFTSLVPTAGSSYVHIQRIGEPPRVHLDFPSADLDADTARLVALGATLAGPRGHWQTLESPGGLPFCIVDETGPFTVPTSTAWSDGTRSRLCQICIDVPPSRHDAELEFWSAATGWQQRASTNPEFHSLLPPSSSPLQLLVQRLDDERDAVRAHIDLGCDDIDAEASRLTRFGASVVARMADWVVLRDPAGLEFCATSRRPDGVT